MAATETRSFDEEQIRAHAHKLWEKDGQPEGRHLEHWRQAEEALGAGGVSDEAGEDKGAKPASEAKRAIKRLKVA